MIFYHGNCIADFEINRFKDSRYGFPALFLTTNIELARLYALWHYRQTWAHGGGMVYEIEVNIGFCDVTDWGGHNSYTPDFRNKIRYWQQCGHSGLLLQNVVDYPHKSLRVPLLSDILVVYKLDNIKQIILSESKITQV
jgi:hypothetical protein